LQNRKLEAGFITPHGPQSVPAGSRSVYIRDASYGLSDANEMAAIKTFLIIVNRSVR